MISLLPFLTCAMLLETDAPAAASQPAASPDGPLVAAVARRTLRERVWAFTDGRTEEATQTERHAYESERSDGMLAILRDIGVNTLVVPYGGPGPDEREAEERRMAAQFAQKARGRGFLVGVWLPTSQVRPADWKQSLADAWLLRDAAGQPVKGDMRGYQCGSWMSPEFRQRASALLEAAQRDVRPDWVLLPSFQWTCGYEDAARAAFGRFLDSSPPTGADAWAKDPSGRVRPPTADDVSSPLAAAWQRFRANAARQTVAESAQAARQAQPPARLGIETLVAPLEEPANVGPAISADQLAQDCDLVWGSPTFNVDSRGRIRTDIPLYKAFERSRARLVLECSDAIEVAQSLAFGGNTAGCIAHFMNDQVSSDPAGRRPIALATVDLARFLVAHQDLYRDAEPVADFVLWRPAIPDAARSAEDRTLYAQTQGAMVSHGLLFTVTTDPLIACASARQVIVLAGVSRVGADMARRLRQHVCDGGGLVIIGTAKIRIDSASTQPPAATQPGNPDRPAAAASSGWPAELMMGLPPGTKTVAEQPGRWRIGGGRLVTLDRPGPPMNMWLVGRTPFVRPPGPSTFEDEFTVAMTWAAGGMRTVESRLPGACFVEAKRIARGAATVLHELNYDARQPAGAGELRVRLPAGSRAARVSHLSPANDASVAASQPASAEAPRRDLPFRQAGDVVTFTAPSCKLYELYVIETAAPAEK